MVKKIGSAFLLIGGAMGVFGSLIAMIAGGFDKAEDVMWLAIIARIGAIIAFVGSIIAIAGCVKDKLKKGGAIASAVFGVMMFVGQILVDPITSERAALKALMDRDREVDVEVGIALIMLFVGGVVAAILGLVGLIRKNKPAAK